ncbi:phytoene desaturase family protein [Mycolicibacterium thermoresistibile]|uniref:Phytoene dehydrogenase family protein n=2 Tax=Mycolicibacterium thermoresistibile TaxID=1797 RepID=G7CBY8_MYCT3|nr:FAD-dependent oxidoreductase [Mycolicibacterium thermoresistibile]EHI14485.1 phytoene dehydrogenase family protein [Mycolicibacterium thermoresistibile ATCC 19527]MCV7187391.1 NAD(P)/FAD-dependent oxidoreductase [Mycolicibacterium thermoresistibile]GAT17001.1 phytoene dehydrogenase family protein [Mycolicibacterium thermoresistibile]SNW16618.1 amine oxidase [Mycolicibacterium thermoresistibile]
MTTEQEFDAIVIGAGAGGLFTAARLAHQGFRTVVVERLDKVGGRASTDDIDGFKVNNGAIVIETGGITQQTCEEVGAPFDIREPKPPILYRIGGKNVDVTGGGWGFLLGKLTRQGAKLVKGIGAARNDSGLPEDEISTAEWVAKYTKNEGVHGIFRNMCASVFAVGSEDLPARVFLTYFTRKSAFKRFGFHPEGTIGLWRGLAGAVERHGGQVWLSTPATKILTDGTAVQGVVVERDGRQLTLTAPVVVSDVGPAATVTLLGEENVPADYRKMVKKGDRPTSMISVNFASRERLVDVPGMLSFAKSRRLAYIANFTDTCPEMAPEGWNLYVGTAVPKPSIGDFDQAAETELLLQDLRDNIDDFDNRARILNIAITRDDWPPQRAVAGFDLPHDTPFANLWNVGDGVKEYANGGTTACAETAKLVVDKILASHRPAASR